MTDARLVLAALIAPLVVPLISVLWPIFASRDPWPYNSSDIWLVIVFSTSFSYLGMAIAGVPAVLVLRRLRRIGLLALIVVGAVSGAAVFSLFGLSLAWMLGSSVKFSLSDLVYGGIFGTSVAIAFGFIANIERLKGS